MNTYIVFFRLKHYRLEDDAPLEFECNAQTKEEAKEQCLAEFPDANVIHVFEYGEYYSMQASLEAYWESQMQGEIPAVIE